MDLKRLRNFNFSHLLYFYAVAREGSIVAASELLRVSQPTVSSQIGKLEDSLGEALFRRVGRGLELTDYGRRLFEWANELFTVGEALLDGLETGRAPSGRRFVVGILDSFPKILSYRLLAPLLGLDEPVLLECHEDKQEALLTDLARHRTDLILTSAPVSPDSRLRAFNHRLGSSQLAIFGTAELTRRHQKRFPAGLQDAPFLFPAQGTSMRRSLERWRDRAGLQFDVVGEMDDSALTKAFGGFGAGLFVSPLVAAHEVCRQYRVQIVGRLEGVTETFYAVTTERRLADPLTKVLVSRARAFLSSQETSTLSPRGKTRRDPSIDNS